jgi:hypothetical protein
MRRTTHHAPRTFSAGIGRWIGSAEVYSGTGQFLGNAHDQRHVQRKAGENAVQIDLSFVGPFKFSGTYTIADHGDYRLYQGPANYGYAETLANNLIDANAYWPITGLTQRFFLMVLPDQNRQLSLALMSRGEQLIYVVVGDYQRVDADWQGVNPTMQNGTSFDFANDPAGGRHAILLQRAGEWRGTLQVLDGDLTELGETSYQEIIQQSTARLRTTLIGNYFDPTIRQLDLNTNDWLAWSKEGEVVGSYSLSGGRALSGTFHHLEKSLRVWRREVVSHDGTHKAVVHNWYRGGQRVGVQFGVLNYIELH